MAPPPKPSAADGRSPSPRKKPHCTHCGSPMLGHKRGQCTSSSNTPAKSTSANDLITRMGSLTIVPDTQVPVIPPKKKSTSVQVEPKKHPFTRSEARYQKWTGKSGPSSPEFSEESDAETDKEEDDVAEEEQAPLSENPPSEASKDDSVVEIARPIGRTNSATERDQFFRRLLAKSKTPAASVFTIDMSDIKELEVDAAKLKLQARVIAPKFKDGTTGEGWLVVGREGHSVDVLFEQVKADLKKPGNGFVKSLGSGVLGAVAAWVYLAFN